MVVVVDNKVSGTSATNRLWFDSNAKVTGMDGVPNTAMFADLKKLTAVSILAPNFELYVNSNFGVAGGSVVAGRMTFDSNAAATVRGTVIALENQPVSMNGNSAVTIESAGTTQVPAGLYFGHRYTPRINTYVEVPPHDIP